MTNSNSHTIDKTRYIDSTMRKDPFSLLGTDLGDHPFTAQEALEFAQLANWNVRKTPLTTKASVSVGGEDVEFDLDVPRQFATVRDNPETKMPQVISTVGNSYVPIQNEEQVDLLDAILDQGGATVATAGSLFDGRRVFFSMKMPMGMQVAGIDAHDLYLTSFNSHDGDSSFYFAVTPVRVRCMNAQAAALKQAVSSFSIRHTANAKNTISEARRVLELTFKNSEAFELEMEKLMNSTMTTRQFTAFAEKLWTPPAADASRTITTRHGERLDLVKNLFVKSPTLTDFRGTKYAAYNAMTEYLDHFSPVPSTASNGQEVRALRTVTSDVVRKTKERAFAMLAS